MLDHFVGLALKELTFPIPNSSWGSKGSGQVFVSFEIIFSTEVAQGNWKSTNI